VNVAILVTLAAAAAAIVSMVPPVGN